MFVVPKSDGSWRPMINLKSLNLYILTRHFKMESIRTAKDLLQGRDYIVKLDLKDVYLSASPTQEVCGLPLVRSSMEVQVPPPLA